MLGDMKLREKSSVFKRCLKISSEGAERAVDGKLFHALIVDEMCYYLLLFTFLHPACFFCITSS